MGSDSWLNSWPHVNPGCEIGLEAEDATVAKVWQSRSSGDLETLAQQVVAERTQQLKGVSLKIDSSVLYYM